MSSKHPELDPRVAKLATDPMRFLQLCWPKMRLYDKQQEVLQSVVRNEETFIHAAHKTGKTRIAAVTAIWFFASRTPARVVVSSSSEEQLRNVLWAEILQLIHTSAVPLPFRINKFRIYKHNQPNEEQAQDLLLGAVTRTGENLQGYHLPHDKPRTLAIFDEASAVPDDFYESAQSWAHRVLVIGNPLSTDNFFYLRCQQGDKPDPAGGPGLLRRVIHISGRDAPNVIVGQRWKEDDRVDMPPVLIPGLLTFEEFLRRKAEWDEVQRTTRLYGEFYVGKHAVLFPAAELDRAMGRARWEELNQRQRKAEAMGVDVAAGGSDLTCWTIIDRLGVIEQITRDVADSMQIAGFTQNLIEQHRLAPTRVQFDAGGGGKQIVDRLCEQGVYVASLNFGEGADDKRAYVNRRAEMYGTLADLFEPEREEGIFVLPPDAKELRTELRIMPLLYDSEGRLRLPPKQHGTRTHSSEKTIRQLLGRSPDRADSLALAAWRMHTMRLYDDFADRDLVCEDESPLTPEEIADMPDELRELHHFYDDEKRQHASIRDPWED